MNSHPRARYRRTRRPRNGPAELKPKTLVLLQGGLRGAGQLRYKRKQRIDKEGFDMAKALKCLKEGCTFEVQGNSVDDVLVKLKMHAMIAHQMPQLPPDLIEKAKTAVRDV